MIRVHTGRRFESTHVVLRRAIRRGVQARRCDLTCSDHPRKTFTFRHTHTASRAARHPVQCNKWKRRRHQRDVAKTALTGESVRTWAGQHHTHGRNTTAQRRRGQDLSGEGRHTARCTALPHSSQGGGTYWGWSRPCTAVGSSLTAFHELLGDHLISEAILPIKNNLLYIYLVFRRT